VFANADTWDTSNVWCEDGCIRLYSKREKLPEMRHIDYGLMVCTRRIFDDARFDMPYDLADSLENLSRAGQLAGYEVNQRFYEIGSPSGPRELDRVLRNAEIVGKTSRFASS